VWSVEQHSYILSSQKLLVWHCSMCWCIVTMEQLILVLPVWIFSTDLIPQMLQNHAVVMLFYSLLWSKNILMNNALTVKYKSPACLWCLTWIHTWRGFIRRGLLLGFRFIRVNSGFLSSYSTWEEVLVSSDYTEHFMAHKYTLLLLLVIKQVRWKLCGDQTQLQVLPYNSLACSTWEPWHAIDLKMVFCTSLLAILWTFSTFSSV
jgi:hypothetical protein